ncbi:hypothetical protein [Granulicella sibirica]|uniref:Uncharacterized protein n=1 Tax=Granulicella sibirica TaxID=2479048 RepID=A0A4Q0SW08_9BACT|nr:hypothetical protein [Granulicella sibirica]RXH54602.1 hypothetical protein GRAN_3706 [Granulicella sibirica]
MLDRGNHLSDADILGLIDREDPWVQADGAREHLLACVECIARLERIQKALGELDDMFASQSPGALPSAMASRLRLQGRLRAAGASPERVRWAAPGVLVQIAAIAAVVLVAVGVAVYGWRRTALIEPASLPYAKDGPVPNRMLTPGAIRPVTLWDICKTVDDDLDPSVAPALQSAVLREYGIAGASSQGSYQIDYLVNPQLGGTNDIKNLWPQPYHEGVWNAHAKDELEKHLHEMVCNRTVDLTVAQHEIATDWIAAYKKYLHQTPA